MFGWGDDEGRGDDARGGGARGPVARPTIFVSDASAEVERLARVLETAGYDVADVPLALLSARVAAQRPNLILVDADADGALAEVERIRDLPESGVIDVVLIARDGGAVRSEDEARAREASGLLRRPLDTQAALVYVERLTGGAPPRERRSAPPSSPTGRPSTRWSSMPSPGPMAAASPASRAALDRASSAQLPPSSVAPGSSPALGDILEAPRSMALGQVSPELATLLASAEERLGGAVDAGPRDVDAAGLPPGGSPEEEIEAVLPAEVLAALDEPLDDEDERDATRGDGTRTTHGGSREATQERRETGTGASSYPSYVPGGGDTGGVSPSDAPAAPASPRARARFDTMEGPSPVADLAPAAPPPVAYLERPAASHATPHRASAQGHVPAGVERPAERTENDAPVVATNQAEVARELARAVTRLESVTLAFEADEGVRHVVVREGDLVTAASSLDDESLVAFLVARGELPRSHEPRLRDRIPPHGRHAGAALVAHGYVQQDQLWTVLREHAQWLLSAVLRTERAVVRRHLEPQGRLRAEPSVFGGQAGAAIFVETVRRTFEPARARDALGGHAAVLASGPAWARLRECDLAEDVEAALARAPGRALGEVLEGLDPLDGPAAVFALVQLEILEALPALRSTPGRAPSEPVASDAMLDEEAVRARVAARAELVDEGDYFAVLGVARDATGYEIRRAYLELRRTFEPSRLLGPSTLDLTDEVRRIVLVVDEAYEILRDEPRRERYRRALEA